MNDDEPADVLKLGHELSVYRVELELQNEELRQGQLELQSARDRYLELFELAPVGYALVDATGTIELANLWLARELGYRRDEVVGRKLVAFLASEDAGAFHRFHADARAGGTAPPLACELRGAGGEPVPVTLHARPPARAHEPLALAVVDARDRLAAEHAQRSERDLRRGFVRALLRAQDDERRRLARELHDEAGQSLATLEVGLARLVGLGVDPAVRELGEQLAQLARTTAAELRRCARGLHPWVLEDLGLAPALERLAADQAAAHDVAIEVNVSGLERLASAPALAIYRVVQEALSNAMRHADAEHVRVSVVRTGLGVGLAITDDGRGFVVDARTRAGLGLRGMRERIEDLGGTFTLESRPSAGTTVRGEIPWEALAP